MYQLPQPVEIVFHMIWVILDLRVICELTKILFKLYSEFIPTSDSNESSRSRVRIESSQAGLKLDRARVMLESSRTETLSSFFNYLYYLIQFI